MSTSTKVEHHEADSHGQGKRDKHKRRGYEKSGAPIKVDFLREYRHEGKGSGRFRKNKDEGSQQR